MKSVIDPRTVLVAMPSITGQNHSELTGALIGVATKMYGFLPILECSHPSLARNVIAEIFLSRFTHCEWLVCVDSDIAFHPQDFDLLMETVDRDANYTEPGLVAPTRVTTALCQEGLPLSDKMVGAADALVCAQYRYKRDDYDVVRLGMGFVRIHRSVFEALMKMEHEPNPAHFALLKVAQKLEKMESDASAGGKNALELDLRYLKDQVREHMPPAGGGPRLSQVQRDGRLLWDFFPSGPLISQFVPTSDWKGEDHGFFTLCMLAGIYPRIETRTRLVHIGRKGYPYDGPDGVAPGMGGIGQ